MKAITIFNYLNDVTIDDIGGKYAYQIGRSLELYFSPFDTISQYASWSNLSSTTPYSNVFYCIFGWSYPTSEHLMYRMH